MTKKYQCVIFDWDGTLMDSEARIVASIQYAAKHAGYPVLPYDVSKSIIGLSLEKAIYTLYPDATEAGIAAMAKGYTEYFLNHADVDMKPFDGAEALLQMLKKAGVKTAIATGKSRRGLDQVLSEVGFESYFDMTRTPVEAESKPSPLMLQQIIDEFGLAAAEAVMVGDTEFDMQMAQNINMDVIALSHGVHDLDVLKTYEPVSYFDDLHSMTDWLQHHIKPFQSA
ncbi:HAD family hydrolase [Hydrogenovibrio kuenenii]|uniref:HAD family hydrolase n=1 Tax=Hydrogenovibrio kuenenii TaxID=63658 RepID=UPI00046696D9|nr:HAD-IA family hydrolase [Hydrogenovibrio kuenenii]